MEIIGTKLLGLNIRLIQEVEIIRNPINWQLCKIDEFMNWKYGILKFREYGSLEY